MPTPNLTRVFRVLCAVVGVAQGVARAQQYAPSLLAGRSAVVVISDGSGMFADIGGYRVAFAPTGNTYTVSPLSDTIIPSSGTYSYTKTGANTANFVFNDSVTGVAISQAIVFSSPTTATYSIDGILGTQSGTLVIEDTSRLIAISTRARVGVDSDAVFAGFAIQGPTPKRVVIRVVGPTLGTYGVPGVLEDPVLELNNQAGGLIAQNDDWSPAAIGTAFQEVGLFPLANGSKDAALVTTLNPGTYTATGKGKNGATGVAIIEVYELP